VWGDLACPWCYVGKSRLDKAIASSPHAEAVTVVVRSFELDPAMSHDMKPNLEVLSAKCGLSLAQARVLEDKVVALAQREGLPSTADRVLLPRAQRGVRALALSHTSGSYTQRLVRHSATLRWLTRTRVQLYDDGAARPPAVRGLRPGRALVASAGRGPGGLSGGHATGRGLLGRGPAAPWRHSADGPVPSWATGTHWSCLTTSRPMTTAVDPAAAAGRVRRWS
jgi:DSBA-like thioredoxin domain